MAGHLYVVGEGTTAGVLGTASIKGRCTVATRLDKRGIKVAIAADDVSDNLAAGEDLDIVVGQVL